MARVGIQAAAIAGAIAVAGPLAAWGQNVPVDHDGLNRGNLQTGAVLFGGDEPPDPIACAHVFLPNVPQAPCPKVSTMEGIASARTAGPQIAGQPPKFPSNQYGLDFYTDNNARLSITHGGLVGIGTQAPAYTMHLEQFGDVQLALKSKDSGGKIWTLQSSGNVDKTKIGTFQIIDRDQNVQRLGIDGQGMVTVKSLQITGGADLAEPFEMASPLPPGSLVVIDPRHPGQLLMSTRAYDRRVAGIVSGANSVFPGVVLEQLGTRTNSQQVALSGRVFGRADASNGAIEPGDLLTSSNQPGQVMKAINLRKAQGAIVGKAMSSLATGEGLVLILVSLQ